MAHPFKELTDSIWTYVRKFVAGITGQPGSLISTVGNPEVYHEINQEKAITSGFKGNTAVYSIVMKDAKKFGSIPRYLLDASKTEEKSVHRMYEVKADGANVLENDLSKLLNRPNDYQSQDAFFTAVRAYFKICGEAFIWLNRGDVTEKVNAFGQLEERSDEEYKTQPVLEMFVLPSNKVIVVPDESLWGVNGYYLDLGGQKMPLHRLDVIHWKSTNLDFDAFSKGQLRGMPALTPGYKTLEQNNSHTDASVRMAQNDGAKGAMFNETFNKLTPVQETQIDRVIERKINNNDRKGAVVQLQGKWGYINFGGTSVDLQLLEGKELSWKELCFLFGVPYDFYDSHTPYAEKQLAQQGWLTNEIIPDCKQLDGEMNRMLLPAFGLDKTAFIASDYWDLPEMQAVRKDAAEGLMKLWPVTPNQVLEAIGYEPRPEKEFDEPWVPQNVKPFSQMNDDDDADELINQFRNDSRGNRA